MQELLNQLDDLDRRSFIEYTAKSMLGLSLVPALGEAVAAAPSRTGTGWPGQAPDLPFHDRCDDSLGHIRLETRSPESG